MKKFFVDKTQINDNIITIQDDQFLHLAKVLRCQVGEKIICFCGNEFEYHAEITQISKRQALAQILSKTLCNANPKYNITLFQGLAKGEKLDLITQKCTELGLSKLILFESDFTIAKDTHPKLERLTKVSQEACKQCGRSKPIEICPTIKLKDINNMINQFDLVLFPYEQAKETETLGNLIPEIKTAKNLAIIVGAEGGFSEKENKMLTPISKPISLGARILRTETASIATTGFISFIKNN